MEGREATPQILTNHPLDFQVKQVSQIKIIPSANNFLYEKLNYKSQKGMCELKWAVVKKGGRNPCGCQDRPQTVLWVGGQQGWRCCFSP